jgi:hypothetical protein
MYGRKGVVVVLVCTVRRPEGLLAHLALTPYHSGMKRRAAVMNPNDVQISHAKSQMRRSFPGAMRCLVGVVFPGSWCAEIEEAISDALARGNGKAGALEQPLLEGSKGGACVGIKEPPRAVPAHLLSGRKHGGDWGSTLQSLRSFHDHQGGPISFNGSNPGGQWCHFRRTLRSRTPLDFVSGSIAADFQLLRRNKRRSRRPGTPGNQQNPDSTHPQAWGWSSTSGPGNYRCTLQYPTYSAVVDTCMY